MAKEVQTKLGTCATHGQVQGTRMIPKVTFPPIFTAILRSRAKRLPYKCPECGADVLIK